MCRAGQVANRAGDNGNPVTLFAQVASKLMMAGSSWLVYGGERLVYQQYMHFVLGRFLGDVIRQGPLAG